MGNPAKETSAKAEAEGAGPASPNLAGGGDGNKYHSRRPAKTPKPVFGGWKGQAQNAHIEISIGTPVHRTRLFRYTQLRLATEQALQRRDSSNPVKSWRI